MSVEVEKLRGVPTWYYRFRLNGKRYCGWLLPEAAMTKRKAEAEEERIKAKILLDLEMGKARTLKPLSAKQVFESHAEYLKMHRMGTYISYRYLFPHLKFFHKDAISPQDIMDFKKLRLSQDVSEATVNRELLLGRAAFNRALKQGLVKENPFAHFEKFTEAPRTRYLSREEITRLLSAADSISRAKASHFKEIVITAMLTGMRKDEILRLHKQEIHLDEKTIHKAATGTKKYQREKVIPLSGELLEILRAKLEKSKSGYVFECPLTGKPYGDVKSAWWKALELAGIKDFRFHDLRRTFGTYALLASQDLRTVQELLGHSNIETTQRYTHILSEQKERVVDSTSAIILGQIHAGQEKISADGAKPASALH